MFVSYYLFCKVTRMINKCILVLSHTFWIFTALFLLHFYMLYILFNVEHFYILLGTNFKLCMCMYFYFYISYIYILDCWKCIVNLLEFLIFGNLVYIATKIQNWIKLNVLCKHIYIYYIYIHIILPAFYWVDIPFANHWFPIFWDQAPVFRQFQLLFNDTAGVDGKF